MTPLTFKTKKINKAHKFFTFFVSLIYFLQTNQETEELVDELTDVLERWMLSLGLISSSTS